MMSTSVADVSLMLTKVSGTVNQIPAANSRSSETESFTSFMNTSAEKSEDNGKMNDPVKQTKTVVEKPGRKDLEQQQTKETQADEKVENNVKDPIDTVSKSINEIKDAIEVKFSLTDEELMSVMETLNMSMVDLLNPDLLKDLMIAINGQEDVVFALTDETLYTDMMDIVNLATEFTSEIKETFQLTEEEFAGLMEEARSAEVTVEEMPVIETNEVMNEVRDEKAPEIKVEVKIDEAQRTADPIIRETQETPVRQTQDLMKKEDSDDNEAPAQMAQPQQTQTVVRQVGDVVETVRTFSTYTEGEEIVRQLTDSIKVNISPEETSMELQLHPASLGTIHVNVASQNGVVTAQLLVQNETVRDALTAQMAQLQETFEEQGTKVEAVEVTVASYDLDRGPFQDRDDRQDRQNADDHRTRRRVNLNLNDLNAEEIELSEEDQLAKDVMEMNGTSVDFSA